MKLQRTLFCLLFLTTTLWLATKVAGSSVEEPAASREFNFTYSISVPRLPKNSRDLRIWIPVATSNPHQSVKLLRMSGTVPLRITRESEYGDSMAYAEVQ